MIFFGGCLRPFSLLKKGLKLKMSLKNIVLKTFLFLALGCFWASSAFASLTFKWYQSADYLKCDLSYNPICNYTVSSWAPNSNYTYSTCRENGTSVEIARKQKTSTWIDGVETITYVDSGYSYVGNAHTLVCPDNTKISLRGCTASCVADPCLDKRGQREAVSVECGTASCASGVTVAVGGSSFACSVGAATFTPKSPTGDAVKDSCEMIGISSSSPPTIGQGLAKVSDIGSSTVKMYCSYQYEYTGKSGGQDTPDPNASMALTGGASKMPEDGICKDPAPLHGTLNGVPVCYPNELPDSSCPIANEKPNSTGLCVPPTDPTYPKDTDPTKPDPKTGCDVGKIKNASGVCVPYADATKCKVGEIRSNTGICTVDPKATKCEQGQVKNALGSCSADPRGTGCNTGLPDKLGICPDGSAACAVGKIRDSSGVCVAKDSQNPDGTGCKDGSKPNLQGVCADGSGACPVGKIRNNAGVCVTDTNDANTSGSASANCETAPECGGDPLQCASLEQIWRSGCEQTKAMSEISQEDADKMASAAAAAKTEGETHQAAVDSQAEGFFSDFESKANSVSSSAECISDASFSVMGKSLVVPFSQACPFFKFLRLLVLFSAYMLSARILFGGVS